MTTKRRKQIDIGMADVAFDKLIEDLLHHANYFEDTWMLLGVAADCRQAAIELRNLRNKVQYLLTHD